MRFSVFDIPRLWDRIVVDFQTKYGIDLEDPKYADRSWPWLLVRIYAIVGDTTSYTHAALRSS